MDTNVQFETRPEPVQAWQITQANLDRLRALASAPPYYGQFTVEDDDGTLTGVSLTSPTLPDGYTSAVKFSPRGEPLPLKGLGGGVGDWLVLRSRSLTGIHPTSLEWGKVRIVGGRKDWGPYFEIVAEADFYALFQPPAANHV